MDILASSYENIGPFVGEPLTVFFKKGAYLVKAPIGSGKSFLFFDGPVFALYKYAARPMLHRGSKRGTISLIFEESGSFWYVRRQIKSTPSGGESVQSTLYALTGSKEQVTQQLSHYANDVIVKGLDVFEVIVDSLEEMSFGSQRELDATLQSFLPPREALLAINFLMQDSQNVFELTPAKRVLIFKHLFGLVGIDEAKDRIASERKEVQGMVRLLQTTTEQDTKLQEYITSLQDHISYLGSVRRSQESIDEAIRSLLSQPFFADLSVLNDHIKVEKFSVGQQEKDAVAEMLSKIESLRLEEKRIVWEYEQREGQRKDIEQEIRTLQQQCDQTKRELVGYKESLQQASRGVDASLQTRYDMLQGQIVQAGQCHDLPGKELFELSQPSSLGDYYAYIQNKIEEGKQVMHEKQLKESDRLSRIQKRDMYNQKCTDLQDQIVSLSGTYTEQMTFHCDKIDTNCPYIEVIKGQSALVLQRQREKLQHQLDQTRAHINEENVSERLALLDTEIERLKTRSQQIRDFLSAINRKVWVEKYDQYIAKKDEIARVQEVLMKQERQQQKKNELEKQVAVLEDRMQSLHSNIKEKQMQSAKVSEEVAGMKQRLNTLAGMQLEKLDKSVRDISVCLDAIGQLVEQHTSRKLQMKQLQTKEKQLKELYTIFSKELLFVVLQDFLPQLEQTINSYLQQIVTYEVRFDIPSSYDDTIELEISIHDEKGVRPVKSLSGGQKAILKIAWILSVSTMLRSSFLFLDETITSLDADAIAKVADVLENYVTFTSVKLYVVTHAQQIQDMSIRDKQVYIN